MRAHPGFEPRTWQSQNIFHDQTLSKTTHDKNVAPPGGLEPPTFRLTAERASRLRHGGNLRSSQLLSHVSKNQCPILTKIVSTRMGFEPTRAEPIGLAVQRLNHSATSSYVNVFLIFCHSKHLYCHLHCVMSILPIVSNQNKTVKGSTGI